MLTKNAIGNLINRYEAVLNKCNVLNKVSSIIRKGLVTTGACALIALTPVHDAKAINLPSGDYYSIEPVQYGTDYYTTFDLVKNGIGANFGLLFKAGPSSSATFNTPAGLANGLILNNNPNYSIATGSGGLHNFNVNINGQNLAYTVTSPSSSLLRIASLTSDVNGGVFYGLNSATNGGAIFVGSPNDNLSINGSFINNTSGDLGGAIILWGSSNNIINGTFIGNSSANNGGAIYAISGSGNSASGMFIGNSSGVHGGAIANASTMDSIDGIFIGNIAKTWGGAIFNNGGQVINSIKGTYIANNAIDGGAIFNSDKSFIGSINASFIGNTAETWGGAIANKGFINTIDGVFIANTAGEYGGALHNFASTNMSDAQIGYIDASFINNKTINPKSLGGAIWTNRSLTFRANNRVNVFIGNMDSTGYNAIFVNDERHDSLISLDFDMLGNGGFVVNDSIVSNGIDFYDVNITGEGYANNVFELNNTMSEVHTLNVTNSKLRIGTVNQGGQKFVGRVYTRNAIFGSQTILEVPVDNGPSLVSSGGVLNVDPSARLHVVGIAPTGTTIDIAQGFNEDSAVYGWSGNNVAYITPTSLQQIKANPFDVNTGTFSVKIYRNSAIGIAREYPEMQSKSANLLSNVDADVYSESAGVRLLSRATDTRYLGRDNSKLATRTIEGLLQVGYLAGLNKTGLDVGLTAANSLQARLSPTGLGTAKGEAPAVTMLNESAALVNNDEKLGLSAGSNMQAGGIQDGFALWLSPLYKHSFAHGFESGSFEHSRATDMGGLSLGADYTFNEMFRLGLAFNLGTGYTRSQGDFDETTNDFDFWALSLYGAFYKNNFALLADVGLSKVFGEVEQDLPSSIGMSTLDASPSSTVWTAGLRAEYTFNTSFMDITPYVGARYMHVQTHEYDVKSGGTVASVEADNQGVWYFPVGVSFTKDIVTKNDWIITPKLDLGIVAATGDLNTTSSTNVSGVSGVVDYTMQNVDGIAFSGGAGLEIVKDNFSMGFNYNLLASEHETGHTLFATFKYTF